MPEPVIYSVDDVSDEDAETLRQKFLQRIQADDLKDHIHPADARRARTDPMWCKRFLAHGDLDISKALEFMIDSAKFRKTMGVNDMTDESVHQDFFNKGVLSVHGRDVNGARILIFAARLHERLSGDMFEEVKKFLVYWVEKLEREERGKRISLFFDMAQAGVSNIDISFIQYLINLFKYYYPDMLSAIIVFELPWIMNAAWKIIKGMLPAKSHQLIKFVSKKDVNTMVPPECCLTRWGGDDQWTYSFRPEECHMIPSPFLGDAPPETPSEPAPEVTQVNGHVPTENGHAGHAKVNGQVKANGHVTSDHRPSLRSGGHARLGQYHSAVETAAETDRKVHFPDDSSTGSEDLSEHKPISTDLATAEIRGLLEVSPGDEIRFSTGSHKTKHPLVLTNIRGSPVAFKVKTTSPEKFCVQPACGIVPAGRRQTVDLRLCEGVQAQNVVADKFLLLAAPVQQERVPAKDMGRLWRSLPSEEKQELRLRCGAVRAENDPLMTLVRGLGQRLETVGERLARQQQVTERGQRQISWLVLALLLLALQACLNVFLVYRVVNC